MLSFLYNKVLQRNFIQNESAGVGSIETARRFEELMAQLRVDKPDDSVMLRREQRGSNSQETDSPRCVRKIGKITFLSLDLH